MLVVGMALFAAPIAGEPPGATITLNTVKVAPQFVGAFFAVTDVSPAITLAESLCSFTINFELPTVTIDMFNVAKNDNSLYRQEVIPIYGYSKAAVKDSTSGKLTMIGWYRA